MAFTKDNIIFVYRDLDSDSLELAQYYQSFRDLDSSHLVPITCSTTEVLADYSAFNTEVESQILSALTSAPLSSENIMVIVLGLNVPGGFYDGTDVISSVSRIMKIKTAYSKKRENFFYIQKMSDDFVLSDTDYSYIVGRIDAPTLSLAKSIIDKTRNLENKKYITGSIFVNPYFASSDSSYDDYKNNIVYFLTNKSYLYNLTVNTTQYKSSSDSVFPQLINDSFYFGGINKGSSSFFGNTDSTRLFFYDTNTTSTFDIRNSSSLNWSYLAISNDYICTSGSMSDASANGCLNIQTFFESLRSGQTIGEAFLYSLPYHNWTMTFIGDPAITVSFPANGPVQSFCSGLKCDYCPEYTPSEIQLLFSGIELNNVCITGSDSGSFQFLYSDIEINDIHRLEQVSSCKWEKTYSNVIHRKRWSTNTTCGGTSDFYEITDLYISLEIYKKYSNIYFADITIKDSSNTLDTYVYLYYSSNNINGCDLSGNIYNNSYNSYLYNATNKIAIVGKNGSSTITHTICPSLFDKTYVGKENTESNTWNDSSINLAKSIIEYDLKREIYYTLLNTIVNMTDVSSKIDLLHPSNTIYNNSSTDIEKAFFSKSINNLFDWARYRFVLDYKSTFPNKRQPSFITLYDFLIMKNYKISQYLLNVLGLTYSDLDLEPENIYKEGYWEYITTFIDYTGDYATYNFEIDVAYDSAFSDIVYSLDSSTDLNGWYVENDIGADGIVRYIEIPNSGIPTKYIGKRIKYSSPVSKYLTSGALYYIRFRQKIGSTYYDYITSTLLVFS